MSRFFLGVAAFAAVLLLMACSGSTLPTAPPPTVIRAPTQVAIEPTTAPPTIAPTNTTAPTLAPTETATLAPTATAEPTTAPSATVVASDENCIACHTSQAKLEELAVSTTVKSEETSGEG